MVGLELPNREKKSSGHKESGGGPPGPAVKKGQESGSLHSPALPRWTSQGEWCSCGQLTKCWIQRGPWEKRLSSGTHHSCLSFTTGSETGLSEPALQITDLAAPSKPGPFQ